MKRSRSVALFGVPIIAASFAACDRTSPTPTPTHIRVCRDSTGRVMDDWQCERPVGSQAGALHWWYMPYVRGGYPIGSGLLGGQATEPLAMPGAGAPRVAPNATVRGGFGQTGSGESAGS